MNDPVMELRGVSKSYGYTRVLRDLDLVVPQGCVMGLIGKNGAGKTTLIKSALGLLRPDAGTIRVLGEPAWTLSAEAKARLGYVPQVVELYRWMKVRQLIAYVGAFYPRWNHQKVEQFVATWEVDPEKKAGALSVGELQRLAIILALGHEPDLLVLDEPVASLDPAGRRSFLKTLLEMVSERRCTVLFSTHITSDLERVADRVAILKDGRIIYSDGLDELKDEVKSLSIAASRPLPAPLPLPGILQQRVEGKEAMATVRRVTPDLLERIERQLDARVEVHDLNLEDIFLELHRD